MKLKLSSIYLTLLTIPKCDAFTNSVSKRSQPFSRYNCLNSGFYKTPNNASFHLSPLVTLRSMEESKSNKDCGCAPPTTYSGKPSENAKNDIDHRAVIGSLPLFSVDGVRTSLDEIIGLPSDNDNKTSLVVFLRSLG